MSNVLTPFIPSLFQDLDVVSREMTGFIPSVTRNASAARAAVNEAVVVPLSRAQSSSPISPSMTISTPDAFTLDNVEVKITNAEQVQFALTGEEARGLNNGIGSGVVINQQFAEAIRFLTNKIETAIGTEAALNATRAYGTPAATPFASSASLTLDTAQLSKILDDNGAPPTGRSLVVNTSAGANLRAHPQAGKANEAGSVMTLRQGEILDLTGFSVKQSAGVSYPVIGTAAATADIDTTGYAVGSTTITLASAGSGTIVAGDYVTFASDPNKYLVVTGNADVSAGGTIVIAAPGLLNAISTSGGQAVTVVAKSVRNIGFTQNAIQLVTRAPELVDGRDAAIDSFMLTDPRSGLTFEIRVYAGERMMAYKVGIAWGVKAIKRAHIGALLG